MLGELLSKALPFLLLPYLTRALGPAGFGELSLYQVLVSLLFILISLNHEGAIARYYFFYGKRAVALVVMTSTLYSTAIFLLGTIFALFFDSMILFVLLFCAYTQSLINTQLIIRQMQKRVYEYLSIQTSGSILSLLLTVFVFEYFESSASVRVAAISVSNLSVVILTFFIVPGGVSRDLKKIKLTRAKLISSFIFLFSFGAPLILHNLSLYSKGQLDRIFVYSTYTGEQLGYYSAGFQIATILSILLMAANKAFIPYLYEGLKSTKISFHLIKKYTLISLIISPFPALIAYIIPQYLYVYVLGDAFAETKMYTVLFLLGIGVTLPYYIVVNYLFYYGKTKYISVATLISAFLHVGLITTLGQVNMYYMAASLFFTNIVTLTMVFIFAKRLSHAS